MSERLMFESIHGFLSRRGRLSFGVFFGILFVLFAVDVYICYSLFSGDDVGILAYGSSVFVGFNGFVMMLFCGLSLFSYLNPRADAGRLDSELLLIEDWIFLIALIFIIPAVITIIVGYQAYMEEGVKTEILGMLAMLSGVITTGFASMMWVNFKP